MSINKHFIVLGLLLISILILPIFSNENIESYYLVVASPIGFIYSLILLLCRKKYVVSTKKFLALCGMQFAFTLFALVVFFEVTGPQLFPFSCDMFNLSSEVLTVLGHRSGFTTCGAVPVPQVPRINY